jgi:hypothetical protein
MPRLIYPEKREISEDEVVSWARDLRVTAVMNGAMSDEWVSVTTDYDGVKTTITTVVKDPSFEEAQAELSDAGVATFARDDAD